MFPLPPQSEPTVDVGAFFTTTVNDPFVSVPMAELRVAVDHRRKFGGELTLSVALGLDDWTTCVREQLAATCLGLPPPFEYTAGWGPVVPVVTGEVLALFRPIHGVVLGVRRGVPFDISFGAGGGVMGLETELENAYNWIAEPELSVVPTTVLSAEVQIGRPGPIGVAIGIRSRAYIVREKGATLRLTDLTSVQLGLWFGLPRRTRIPASNTQGK